VVQLYIVILVVEVILAIAALVYLPNVILNQHRDLSADSLFDASIQIRKMIVSAFGSILIASTAFLAWQEFRLEEYKDFGKQVGTAMNLLKETETTARIGGVYGLARVIDDSPDDADYLLAALAFTINDWASKKTNGKNQSAAIETTVAFNTFGRNQYGALAKCDGIVFSKLNLRYIRAKKTSYTECEFLSVDFTEAQLQSSSFVKSRLTAVNFQGADLSQASFLGAHLQAVNFREADIRGVNFVGAVGLSSSSFKAARVDKKTRFPSKFKAEVRELVIGELH